MKFIHLGGDYACRDGVTFLFKNPTTVENKTTIEKLMKDPLFAPVDTQPKEVIQSDSDGCPKCGRIVKQGRVMHERFCKGV